MLFDLIMDLVNSVVVLFLLLGIYCCLSTDWFDCYCACYDCCLSYLAWFSYVWCWCCWFGVLLFVFSCLVAGVVGVAVLWFGGLFWAVCFG